MTESKRMINMHNYILKIIVVGDSSVGKSNLLLQFTDNNFNEYHDLTIGVEFGIRTISYDNDIYKIQIWDTAGQEAFQAITRSYYRGAVGCLLVYDITNRNTFDHIVRWLDEVKTYSNNQELVISIVGNKTDIEELREVTIKEGEELAKKHGLLFIETSAKTGYNVNEVYLSIIKEIKKKISNEQIILKENNEGSLSMLHSMYEPSYCCY